MKTIDYTLPENSVISSLGRNGTSKQRGVAVDHGAYYTQRQGYIRIIAINSRGYLSKCVIEIPMENVQEFITTIQEAVKKIDL